MLKYDMDIDIVNHIGRMEFDYPALMSALSGYRNPREKVTSLLRKGVILRVKKGLYVLGDAYRSRPFSREVLANLVYGPSFVSMDYALSHHGLIPERVDVLTSVTTRRSRRFRTPVGTFVYRQVPKRYYPLGMDRVERGDVAFLIAVAERALADKILDDRGRPLSSQRELSVYLLEDLRIDPPHLAALDGDLVENLGRAAKSRKIIRCAAFLRRLEKQA